MTFLEKQKCRGSRRNQMSDGAGRGEQVEHGAFENSDDSVTVTTDTWHYTFAETSRAVQDKGGSTCKRRTLVNDDVLISAHQL